MNAIKLLFCTFLCSMFFIQCDEDSLNNQLPNSIIEFKNSQEITTATSQKRLIGLWKWKFEKCVWGKISNENERRHLGLTTEFLETGDFVTKMNGDLLEKGTWSISSNKINTTPSVSQLNGFVSFCGELVEFDDSPRDGCTNYFQKEEIDAFR